MTKGHKCPICKGSGVIPEPYQEQRNKFISDAIMTKLLRKEGYSFRQIMRFLGYKSSNSIVRLAKRK